MATRSAIIMKTEKGYLGIYCHHDGYLEGVGFTLAKHYTDPEKVKKLISLGDISSLGEEVEPKDNAHSYNTPEKNVTVAYGRDRGEENTKALFNKNLKKLLNNIDHSYYYVLKITIGLWVIKR
jgi:hypothetical protein